MLEPLLVRIITPKKIFYSAHAESMIAPGINGFFGVLSNHAPLMTESNGGRLRVKEVKKADRFFRIGPGFIEVENNEVIILTKEAEDLTDTATLSETKGN